MFILTFIFQLKDQKYNSNKVKPIKRYPGNEWMNEWMKCLLTSLAKRYYYNEIQLYNTEN